jgi:hypothetical protein
VQYIHVHIPSCQNSFVLWCYPPTEQLLAAETTYVSWELINLNTTAVRVTVSREFLIFHGHKNSSTDPWTLNFNRKCLAKLYDSYIIENSLATSTYEVCSKSSRNNCMKCHQSCACGSADTCDYKQHTTVLSLRLGLCFVVLQPFAWLCNFGFVALQYGVCKGETKLCDILCRTV